MIDQLYHFVGSVTVPLFVFWLVCEGVECWRNRR